MQLLNCRKRTLALPPLRSIYTKNPICTKLEIPPTTPQLAAKSYITLRYVFPLATCSVLHCGR